MPYIMMNSQLTFLFLALVAGMSLFLAGYLTYVVVYFRDVDRNPDKHRPCSDTFPCGDRARVK